LADWSRLVCEANLRNFVTIKTFYFREVIQVNGQRKKFTLALTGIFIASSLFSASSSHAGLFGPSSDTKKWVAVLKKLAPIESNLLSRYSSVTGSHYTSDADTAQALLKIIPDVNAYIDKLDAITPKDPKFLAGINTYIQAWNDYAQGMEITLSAIQTQDYSKAASANQSLSQGRALERQAMVALSPFLKP